MNPNCKLKVIFVDDEINLLNGLKRFLRKQASLWDMRFYSSAQEALDELNSFRPDVVVTDMRMPNINGVEFLEKVRAEIPSTIRIILSGFSDREMILRSVGSTHQFFTKPVDANDIVEAIMYSESLYGRLCSRKIQEIIGNTVQLPTPSKTYDLITDELNKAEPNIDTVSDIVREDIALSLKLLHLVNSAFFGISQKVADISQATMILGVDVLKYLALSMGWADHTFSSLNGRADIDALTRHSVEVARMCESFAGYLGWRAMDRKTAFSAGLMHDVGKLLLASYYEEKYYLNKTFSFRQKDSAETLRLEEEMFGVNHADIGGALMALWGLPPKIVRATAFHHRPGEIGSEDVILSTIVHAADACSNFGEGLSFEALVEQGFLDPVYLEKVGVMQELKEWFNGYQNNNE